MCRKRAVICYLRLKIMKAKIHFPKYGRKRCGRRSWSHTRPRRDIANEVAQGTHRVSTDASHMRWRFAKSTAPGRMTVKVASRSECKRWKTPDSGLKHGPHKISHIRSQSLVSEHGVARLSYFECLPYCRVEILSHANSEGDSARIDERHILGVKVRRFCRHVKSSSESERR